MWSALLAARSPPRLSRCRSVRPEDAATGEEPQSAAKDASVLRRWGLSPAVTRSCAATSVPIPNWSSSSGAVAAMSVLRSASASAISAVSAGSVERSGAAHAWSPGTGSARSSPGRKLAHVSTSAVVVRPLSLSLSGAGAVRASVVKCVASRRCGPSSHPGGLPAAPGSTPPRRRWSLGTLVAVPAWTARAAAIGIGRIGLARSLRRAAGQGGRLRPEPPLWGASAEQDRRHRSRCPRRQPRRPAVRSAASSTTLE